MRGGLDEAVEFESENQRWARMDEVHEEILRLARRLMNAPEDLAETPFLVSRLEQLLAELEHLRQRSSDLQRRAHTVL